MLGAAAIDDRTRPKARGPEKAARQAYVALLRLYASPDAEPLPCHRRRHGHARAGRYV